MDRDSRRAFLMLAGSAAVLGACGKQREADVGAVGDLMREPVL